MCLRPNLSNDNIISALRPGLKTGMDYGAYDLVKTAFRFRLQLRRIRSAYDKVNSRLSESEAEAEKRNQSQSVGTCTVIGFILPLLFPTPTI